MKPNLQWAIGPFILIFLLVSSVAAGEGQSLPQKGKLQPASTTVVAKTPPLFGLQDGTPVKLRIGRTVSSESAHVDETVDFEVLEDVQVNGVTVIPKGGIAWATVTEAQPKRRMGRAGKLNMNIDSVRLSSGEKVALRAVKAVEGGGHVGAMTGAIVATSIVFFPAAPLFLFMHGKDITIPKGTELTAYINGDVALDSAKFATKSASESQPSLQPVLALSMQPVFQPSAVPEASQRSTVAVKSTPDGADITVDGRFMGSTPSSLLLIAGDHKIAVEKLGFKQWLRTITMNPGGSVAIDALLEKIP